MLHAAVSVARRGWWAPVSWSLAVTHLGLLGERTSLGWANRLSLMRGLLPATTPTATPWLATIALATDWVDGRVARTEEPTAFGFYADALADASFWTWFALHHEPSRTVRVAALTAWGLPTAVLTTAYLTAGRSVDYPRPLLLRNASVALQVVVTARALYRRRVPAWRVESGSPDASRPARCCSRTTRTREALIATGQ